MRTGLVLLAALLVAAPAAAVEDPPEPPPVPQVAPPPPPVAPPPPKASLTLGGFASFDWYQYFQEVGSRAPAWAEAVPAVAQVRIAPKLRAKYRFLRAVAEVEFRHDFVDPGRGDRVIVREALVGLRSRGFRLEGGAVQARWGKMDVASPTDNLVAWDYEEFLFPEPLAIPGLVAGYSRGVFSAEVIVSPAFVPSRYRTDSPSRWDNTWFLPRTQTVPTGLMGEWVFDNHYDIFNEPVLPGRPGNLVNGWPKYFDDHVYQPPAMGDLDLDGRGEIVFLTLDQLIVLDINQIMADPDETWPMYGYDPQRTGCANCPEDVATDVGPGEDAVTNGITRVSFAQPAPNPIAGQTTFSFALPARAEVRLEIFDLRGRRVATVTQEEAGPGQQVTFWNGRDDAGRALASGQYLARLQVRGSGLDQTLVHKITVLR